MAYNISAVSNTTGLLDFIQTMDNQIFCIPSACGGEGGLVGAVIMFMVFGVLMFNFISNGKEFRSSIMAASFICSLIGGLLFLMELVNPLAIYISLIVWGISVAIGSGKGNG